MQRARLFVGDREQAGQIGEHQWAPGVACEEIGDILAKKLDMRRTPGQSTVFDMTGLALQDLSVARLVYRRALECSAGIGVAWPW